MNIQDEFRNVSVTVSVTEMGMVDTRYGVRQPAVSRRLNARWLKAKFHYGTSSELAPNKLRTSSERAPN